LVAGLIRLKIVDWQVVEIGGFMSNFITVKEVAALLGKSEKFVYQHQAQIPGYFKLCGAILFDRQLLEDELKKRAKQSARVAVARGNHNL
jgi:hypothetical protein